MTQILLTLVLIVYLWVGVWLIRSLNHLLPESRWKDSLVVVFSLLLMATPFLDEMIGKYQFEALCKANGIESVDVSRARGRSVRIQYNYVVDRVVSWQILPTTETEVQIKSESNEDVLVQYKNYHTKGGWLMRYTPFGMGSSATMLFNGNGCGFSSRDEIFLINRIRQVN